MGVYYKPVPVFRHMNYSKVKTLIIYLNFLLNTYSLCSRLPNMTIA
jgi:hypothetical protein